MKDLPSNSRDYRNLQPSQIVDTIDVLSRRIKERFPQSGLFRVAVELHALAQEAVVRAEKIRRPNVLLRRLRAAADRFGRGARGHDGSEHSLK
ncbi:MAG: hypothetical protein QM775_26705 [Pirellulales bacterium]